MVPPGEISYFFSVGEIYMAADDQKVVELPEHHRLQIIDVPKTNILENIIQTRIPITKTFIKSINKNAREGNLNSDSCAPRLMPTVLDIRKVKKVRDKRLLPSFKDYKPDDEETLI
jgi:hypothetical protein